MATEHKQRKPTKKKVNLHADRYGQLAHAFLRYLERYLPGFRSEPEDARRALCRMIFAAPSKYRAHSHHEGCATFSSIELEREFGRGKFNDINNRLGLFNVVEDWSKVEGRTKPYLLAQKVTSLRDRFLNGCFRRTTRLLTDDGKDLQSLPTSALAAKNKDGQTRRGFSGLPIAPAVPVNLVQLKKLIENIQARLYACDAGFVQGEIFSTTPNLRFLRELHQGAAMLVTQAKNVRWPGRVLHRYEESGSGRIYANGTPNLQNCYRVIREVAMAGMYDIDIENCHYSILAQMAARCGYQGTEIAHYLGNKKRVRMELVDAFGITESQAKQSLIALIYGATFSCRSRDALVQIFNKSPELAARIYQYPRFQALRDDIAGARKVVLAAQEVTRGTIKNCRQLTINLDNSKPRQQLAHLLQGVEAAALEAACRLYPGDIVLLQHDGFTSQRPLDTERIQTAMLKATGYELMVEQKVIQVNLSSAFDDHSDELQHQNANQEIFNDDNSLRVIAAH